jgi:hypothetical protein
MPVIGYKENKDDDDDAFQLFLRERVGSVEISLPKVAGWLRRCFYL